jgi:hypothetical protein
MKQFDPNYAGLIEGDVTRVAVIDPVVPPELGNHVIDPTKPFDVKVEWNVSGLFAPLWLQALGGRWDVSVYCESLGAGRETRLGTATVAANAGTLNYSATVNVPANTLEEHTPGTNFGGIYKLAVAVFLNSNIPGLRGFDLVGFAEGPIIQAEDTR